MRTFIVIIRSLDGNDFSVQVDAASEREALNIIDKDYDYEQIIGCHEVRQ